MENLSDGLRYDEKRRRKSLRYGRMKGIRIEIPAAELRKAGIDPDGPAPDYNVWGRRSGSVMVRLYKERPTSS